ncbi:hypothetical protein, partial [Streptomyces lycii]
MLRAALQARAQALGGLRRQAKGLFRVAGVTQAVARDPGSKGEQNGVVGLLAGHARTIHDDPVQLGLCDVRRKLL